MLRLTLKNLAGNRVRFALTAFAVVLAVSFVVSSFVLTDGLRQQFDGLSAEIVEGTDLMVRPVEPDLGETPNLPDAIVAQVAATDGVADAAPVFQAPDNSIRPIPPDGELIGTNGPPQLALNWVDNPALSSLTLVEGRAPVADGEFTMDVDAAAAHGFALGGTYDVLAPTGTVSETLTGLTRFGSDNATLGATLMQFPTASLQRLTGVSGIDSVAVVLDPGADRAAVQAALGSLAPNTEVIDNATMLSEQQEGFDRGISIMGNVLLGFAAVSLFVSIFIIYNTFAIVLGQRTRELGLLRLVGADPRQLRRSVLGEALVIGVLSSLLGIGAGALVAQGLAALFDALGASLPDMNLVISARTVIVALVVGIGATMVSAVGPARKASRVAPIVALRDGAAAGTGTGRVRLAVGTVILAAGLALGGVGLFAASGTAAIVSLLGLGAATVFIGVTLVSPVAAGPVTRVLSWPARATAGVAGRLAGQNAGRNPQRTATTAAALMIGLAAVTMALVVGESVKAELRSTVASSVTADYMVTEPSGNFPAGLAPALAASPDVAAVSGFRLDDVLTGGASGSAGGERTEASGARLDQVPALFDLDVTQGSLTDWAGTVTDPVAVSDKEADRLGLAPGDTVGMDFASGQHRDLTVVAVFADQYVVETPYLLDLSTWDAVGATPADDYVAFALADGIDQDRAAAVVAGLTSTYPQVDVDTPGQFADKVAGFIDQALTAVNAMVALAVVIALIGIANTLALSVFERTRELGLLRAVGMTRRQLRRMIRLEATLVALFGAALGVITGLGFGWAAVVALPDTVTTQVAVPGMRIVVLVAVAGIAGLLAAWGPARRASRLNVLDAIAA